VQHRLDDTLDDMKYLLHSNEQLLPMVNDEATHDRNGNANREFLRANRYLLSNAYRDVIEELSQASPESLQSPRLCSSVLFQLSADDDASLMWSTFWIEDQPTVDAIGLIISHDGAMAYFPIPKTDLDANRKRAKVVVRYYYTHVISKDSWEAKLLRDYLDAKVVLMRDGKVVSSSEFKVSRYQKIHE
jgi:hypothetical protein